MSGFTPDPIANLLVAALPRNEQRRLLAWQAVAAEDRAALLMALEDARGNGLPDVE